jgi:methylenetetrahydrofolate reductase (NADPH)
MSLSLRSGVTPNHMHIHDILGSGRTTFSFEFFPPRTAESTERLFRTIAELESCAPSFVSVTYGAGGSTRDLTHDLVLRLKKETTLDPIPHLTCVGHSRAEVEEILDRYAEAGVSNLLALRGDMRPGVGGACSDFAYAADLVRAIREYRGHPEARGFGIGVAGFPEGHPATPNRLVEMDYLKAKVEAGADYICTQLFFDNRDFYDFRERCELAGIKVPILAGIMPITSLTGMRRMAELTGGARFPARLLKALQRAGDSADAVQRIGIHYASEQCSDLLHNQVAGIHFYTLNQSTATREIYRNLALPISSSLMSKERYSTQLPAGEAVA